MRPDRYYSRVILIANNPDIDASIVNKLGVTQRDLVVQFNKCRHASLIFPLPSTHLIVFRRHFDTLQHHGFPYSERIAEYIEEHQGRTWCIFTGIAPPDALWPRQLRRPSYAVLNDAEAMTCMQDYPINRDIQFAAPSTGFLILRVLHHLRAMSLARANRRSAVLRRVLMPWSARSRHLEIALVGFCAAGGDGFWKGHSWPYERHWVAEHRTSDGLIAGI